jgi:lipopolysaccharide transport system ATP-binding protein
MGDIAIRAENLSKRYRRGLPSGNDRLSESLTNLGRLALALPRRLWRSARAAPGPEPDPGRAGEFWALKDVSLEVKRGEVVGIVGRNGAGKSTLLKILSRITEPTSGRFGLDGRVGSLLEVGTGFHPELTGRENVYLNGSFLGMSQTQVQNKFDAIAAFAEIDGFLDTPVKRYSSGMQLRLGFAVAAHLEPEILIVDEVLAVGDAAFQKKCLGKIGQIAGSGRTVLFVSHNMGTVSSLCTRAVVLDHGTVALAGRTDEVLRAYQDGAAGSAQENPLAQRRDRTGDGRIRFVKVDWAGPSGEPVRFLKSGQDCRFVLHYESAPGGPPQGSVVVSLALVDLNGQVLLNHRNDFTAELFERIPAAGAFVCRFPKLPLAQGEYSINLYVGTGPVACDRIRDAARVIVEPGDYFGTGHHGDPAFCKTFCEARWTCCPDESTRVGG